MRTLVVREHGAIERSELGSEVSLLHALDARRGDRPVFSWRWPTRLKAKSYVGVIRLPRTTIEILPKVEADDARVRSNLLYMLAVAGRVPFRERDLAALATAKMPLLEALMAIFARRLVDELRRGAQRGYVRLRQDSVVIRGKLLVGLSEKKRPGRTDLWVVDRDELVVDTPLNRVLKRACRLLLPLTRIPATQSALRESLLYYADVTDRVVSSADFESVKVDRNSARFEPLLAFARLVIAGASPAPMGGSEQTFSLLFPMDRLFEEFVGRLLLRHARELGIPRGDIELQGRARRRHLLRGASGELLYRLKPDVLIHRDGAPGVLLDAKWKALDPRHSHDGVAQGDIYQMYAYTVHYGCPDGVLLYPAVDGVCARSLAFVGPPAPQDARIRVAFMDVRRDLLRERARSIEELSDLVLDPAA